MTTDDSAGTHFERDEILGEDRLLTSQEVAAQLGITEGTLRNWRWEGEGPPYVKLGKRLVRYRLGAVRQYVRARGTDWHVLDGSGH